MDANRVAGQRKAKVVYGNGRCDTLEEGDFVNCAVTGEKIFDIEYWSVSRQEAYVDAAASLIAHRRALETAEHDE